MAARGDGALALRVRLLGGFAVQVGSRPVPPGGWRLRKARDLVKLLALAPEHRLHREQVMELLWPERDAAAATNNLRGRRWRSIGRRATSRARRRRWRGSATSPPRRASTRRPGRCWSRAWRSAASCWTPAASAWPLHNLGRQATLEGDHARALAMLEESRALFQESGDQPGLGGALSNLAALRLAQGEEAGAVASFEEAVAVLRAIGHPVRYAWGLVDLADAAAAGDLPRVGALLEEALGLFERFGDRRGIAQCRR
jgi:tetratricopeptide (TPR) repeat protein